MLNGVVEVEVSQVECVPLVIFLQHFHSKVGNKQADARGGVEGCVNFARKFVKSNVFTIVWEDAWPISQTMRFELTTDDRLTVVCQGV
jgi:hypothetical protein